MILPRPPGPEDYELLEKSQEPEHILTLDYPVNLTRQFGELIYLAPTKQYLVTGPKGFEYILKTNAKNYSKDNYFYRRVKPVFGESLLTTDFETWRSKRKISQPAFHAHALKHYGHMIQYWANDWLQQQQTKLKLLTQRKSTPQSAFKINMLTEMNQLTLNIALSLFCGKTLPASKIKTLTNAIAFGNWHASHGLLIKPWIPSLNNLKFYWSQYQTNQILLSLIRERRNETQTTSPKTASDSSFPDLLSLLVNARTENDEPLSDTEILAEFKTLLLTGHETTACGLTWMWYLLAEYPEWCQPLEQELETVLNGKAPLEHNRSDTFQPSQLPLTQAIILETLRLYPPIWSLARRNLEEDCILDYPIPKNSLFYLHIYALHRNPHFWKQPNQFDPSRFLHSAGEISSHHFRFLPFSTGPRTCIAGNLAMLEASLITATLAQALRFNKCTKTRAIPEPCISLRPKQGLWLEVTSR